MFRWVQTRLLLSCTYRTPPAPLWIDIISKVTVDDFFLRYLGTEGLVLELNQARAADFELLARRQIPLAGLLSSRPRIILQREPMISTRDGGVVGYVHLEVYCGTEDLNVTLPSYTLLVHQGPVAKRI